MVFGPALGLAGAGLGASTIGALTGSDDYYRTVRKRINTAFKQMFGAQAQGYGQAEQMYLQAIRSLQQGYDKAESSTRRFGDSARQGVADRQVGRMGGLSQSLSQSGLYNTSLRQSGEMGIQGQGDRELLEIDQMVSGMLGSLQQARGTAEAQAYQGLAGLHGAQTDQRTNLQLGQLGFLYGNNSPALPVQSNPWGAIGSSLGTFSGLFAGGGFGGGSTANNTPTGPGWLPMGGI